MSVTALLTEGCWPRLDVHVSKNPDGPIFTESELHTLGFNMYRQCSHREITIYRDNLSILIEGGLLNPEEINSTAAQQCDEIQYFPEHPLPPQWERHLSGERRSYFVNHEEQSWSWDPPPHITKDDNGGDHSESLANLVCSLTSFLPEEWYCCTYHFPYTQDASECSETDSDIDPDEYSDAKSHSSSEPGDGANADAGGEDSEIESDDGQDVFYDAVDSFTI
jgi:hypothetical protein